MGGLVSLYFMDQGVAASPLPTLPVNPIHKLVTIGTPHNGTLLATTLWNIQSTPPATVLGHTLNPLIEAACNYWVLNPCTASQLFNALNRPIGSGVDSLQNGDSSSSKPYSAVVGETGGFGATESILDQLLAFYSPGASVSNILGNPNDTIVPAFSQYVSSTDWVSVTGVVHTSLWPPSLAGASAFDFPSETSSSAVFNEVLSSLMGNTLSGSVAQSQSRSGLSASARTRSGSIASPKASSSTAPAPIFDLTGYTQVPSSNATFLPANGSTLTINNPTTITVSSSTKTIAETVLLQEAVDPSDFVSIYSTQAPFSMSFTPTRLGSMNFVVFAIFTDNTFATTTLNYTRAPSGSPLDVRIPNPPLSALGLGENVTVNAVADFTNGSIDVTSAAVYSAGSSGTSVFSVGTNGSITATGNGSDWLNATYQGLVGSTLISVGQCSYTLAPASQIVDYGGASISVQVSTQNGCAWTALSDSGWLTFTQSSGSGSTTLVATVAANTSGSQRTANVTIGNTVVSVTQPGTSCSYTPSPATISLPSAGGSGTISVTTSCPFTSSSNEIWATATTLSQSSVAYFVAANTSTQSRTATLNIGTTQVTITESGAITPAVKVTPSLSGITRSRRLR
jgi:hypothetical protein